MAVACSPFQEVKPLFVAIYTTVAAGTVFSLLFILTSLYSSSSPVVSDGAVRSTVGSWFSSPPSHLLAPFSTSMEKRNKYSTPDVNATVNIPSDTVKMAPEAKVQPQDILTRAIWDAPVNIKMPDLMSFRLTKEMVKSRAKDNVIVVTFGNYAFMDFILNWVKHLTNLNVHNLLVGAMDTKLLEALYWKGIPVFDMNSNMNTIDVGWGSPTFHKMGREKVFLINALLPFGYELLMCDTDMVWLKNPLPYIARFPEADILTSSDQVIPTVTDDALEVWQQGSTIKEDDWYMA